MVPEGYMKLVCIASVAFVKTSCPYRNTKKPTLPVSPLSGLQSKMNITTSLLTPTALPTPTPTPTSLPVHLTGQRLSPEAIIGIVCAVIGIVVPLGTVLIKYAIKQHRSKFYLISAVVQCAD
jgi:hypothetical protein